MRFIITFAACLVVGQFLCALLLQAWVWRMLAWGIAWAALLIVLAHADIAPPWLVTLVLMPFIVWAVDRFYCAVRPFFTNWRDRVAYRRRTALAMVKALEYEAAWKVEQAIMDQQAADCAARAARARSLFLRSTAVPP